MDKQTLELMRAFDESVTQFKQFSLVLTTLKQQMGQLESELFNVLELADVEQLNEKVQQTLTYLQRVTTELATISAQSEMLAKQQVQKDKQVINQLTSLQQSVEVLLEQSKQVQVYHQLLTTELSTNVLTLEAALLQNVITDEQIQAWSFGSQEAKQGSFILSQGTSLLLYHSERMSLSLIEATNLIELLTPCSKQVTVYGFEVYFVTDDQRLMCYHLLTHKKVEIETNVTAVKLTNQTLIYVRNQELVVHDLTTRLN